MGIAITCSKCGVRFVSGQKIAKVDLSKLFNPDISYYCLEHIPPGDEYIIDSADKFQIELKPRKINESFNIRKVCKLCHCVFMTNDSRRKYCSKTCASRVKRNVKDDYLEANKK